MKRGAVVAMLAALMGTAFAASTAPSSKEALSRFFSEPDTSFKFDRKKNTLELCADLCEHYRMRSGPSTEAWDTIFLHEYYFVAPGFRDPFRERYADLAHQLLSKYGRSCPSGEEEAAARCVIGELGARHRIEYASVRYDEGYRCQVPGRLTDPKYQGKTKCTRY